LEFVSPPLPFSANHSGELGIAPLDWLKVDGILPKGIFLFLVLAEAITSDLTPRDARPYIAR